MLSRFLVPSLFIVAILACEPTFTGTFTLTALNTTLPNMNSTGLPLLVANTASGRNGRSFQLATIASFQYSNIVTQLSLVDNALVGNGPSDYASGYSLPSGAPISFYEDLPSAPHVIPSPVYCAVSPINPGGYHRLVAKANAPTGLFKMCPTGWLTTVFYDVTADNDNWGYKLSECFDVDLLMIPTSESA